MPPSSPAARRRSRRLSRFGWTVNPPAPRAVSSAPKAIGGDRVSIWSGAATDPALLAGYSCEGSLAARARAPSRLLLEEALDLRLADQPARRGLARTARDAGSLDQLVIGHGVAGSSPSLCRRAGNTRGRRRSRDGTLAKANGQPDRGDRRLGIVGVHVMRAFETFARWRVQGRAGLVGWREELCWRSRAGCPVV